MSSVFGSALRLGIHKFISHAAPHVSIPGCESAENTNQSVLLIELGWGSILFALPGPCTGCADVDGVLGFDWVKWGCFDACSLHPPPTNRKPKSIIQHTHLQLRGPMEIPTQPLHSRTAAASRELWTGDVRKQSTCMLTNGLLVLCSAGCLIQYVIQQNTTSKARTAQCICMAFFQGHCIRLLLTYFLPVSFRQARCPLLGENPQRLLPQNTKIST